MWDKIEKSVLLVSRLGICRNYGGPQVLSVVLYYSFHANTTYSDYFWDIITLER